MQYLIFQYMINIQEILLFYLSNFLWHIALVHSHSTTFSPFFYCFSLKIIKCLFISPQNSSTRFPLHYHLMTLFSFCREYKNNEKSFPRTITDTYQYIFFCGCTGFIFPVIKNIEIVIIANVNSSYSLELIVT